MVLLPGFGHLTCLRDFFGGGGGHPTQSSGRVKEVRKGAAQRKVGRVFSPSWAFSGYSQQ